MDTSTSLLQVGSEGIYIQTITGCSPFELLRPKPRAELNRVISQRPVRNFVGRDVLEMVALKKCTFVISYKVRPAARFNPVIS